jgi:predicted O-linked N-acetylglucosamine transferase (SPINDLY family)
MVEWSAQPGANKFTRASLSIPDDAFVFCVFNQRSKVLSRLVFVCLFVCLFVSLFVCH